MDTGIKGVMIISKAGRNTFSPAFESMLGFMLGGWIAASSYFAGAGNTNGSPGARIRPRWSELVICG